jgi:hypothetical protein
MKNTSLIDRGNTIIGIVMLTVACLNFSCSHTQEYRFEITDDKSGERVAAKVSVTDQYGKAVLIDGYTDRVLYLGKEWCYTDGSFSFTLKGDSGSLEIRRGPETLPVKIILGRGKPEKVIRLHHWTNMHEKGYLNGDIHIHTPFSESAHLQMMAEDLDILNILVGEDSIKNRQFTGRPDPASSPGRTIYVAQEVRDWQMGHLTLLGLNEMVPGYPIVGGTLESYSHTHWLMAHAMDETHRQGGLVAWSHYSNLPGAESPVAVALGKIDALELITYDDPTQLPSHWGPWKNSGMPLAEFPVLRGMDLWYQYLNAGFRLPVAAGTDKMAEDIPMGSNRLYAYTGGDTTYNVWLDAIRKGQGFITNGPLLTFDAGGHSPGDVIEFTGAKRIHARVTARSILPFTTLEIIRNGWVVGHKTVFTEDNPPVDGIYTLSVEADIDLEKSSWVAARVAEDPDIKNRILPRGLSVFAHTNPVYFLKDGNRVKEDASIDYLEKYVKGTVHWLKTGPQFEDPADRLEALRLSENALRVYAALRK